MQITFDPRDLTQAQRQHVAAFLTNWPSASDAYLISGQRNTIAACEPTPTATGGAPLFNGKTEAELLAEEQAADLQPLNPADDNSDEAAARAAFSNDVPERDGEGLPWDRRIHSSSKARNADGRWRIARNITPELVESVKAELRALVAAPVAPVAEVPPPPPPATVQPAPDVAFSAAVQQLADTAPAIVAAANVPPPPPAHAATAAPTVAPETDTTLLFTSLLRDAGRAVADKLITSAELTAICQSHGVANVGLLAARKELVPQIDAQFRALLAGKVQS